MAQKIIGVGEVRCSNCGQIFKKASHCPTCNATTKSSKIGATSYQTSATNDYENSQDNYQQTQQESYSGGFRSSGFNRFGNGFSYSFGSFSSEISQKKRSVTLLLAIILGVVGGHRFYTGHYFSALLMMVFSTVLGWWAIIIIWLIIDIISIFLGLFRDNMGRIVARWH